LSYTIKKIEIDSKVFGYDVWDISDACSFEDFKQALKDIYQPKKKSFVSCKIPINEISKINNAQEAGFMYSETQFRTKVRLKLKKNNFKFPYNYIKIQNEDQLNEVLEIANTTFEHDRYTLDSRIGKTLAGKRYMTYLEKSFWEPDEEIWGVQSKKSGRIVSFRSHRVVSPREVLLLIGGVQPHLKGLGLGIVSTEYCFNQLALDGYLHAISHIPAANIPIINLEVGNFKFRITDAFIVLSKHLY
jgi:hypothetical protein